MIETEIGQKFIAGVREVAAEYPDMVYNRPAGLSCLYVHEGQPSCIVGHVAWKLGMIDAQFEWDAANNDGIHGLFDHLDIHVNGDEVLWLESAQEYQDNGTSWGRVPEVVDMIMWSACLD